MPSLGISGFQFFALTNTLLESHLSITHVCGFVLIITELFSLVLFFFFSTGFLSYYKEETHQIDGALC